MKITETLPRGLTIGSFLAIFFVLGLLPFIAWLLEYKDTISAPLTITTEVTPVDIYARTTGELRLLVKNDSLVAKDAPLAVIRNTAIYEDIQLLKTKLNVEADSPIDMAKGLSTFQQLKVGELRPNLVQVNKLLEDYLTFLNTANHKALIASRATQITQYEAHKELLKEKAQILAQEKKFEEKLIQRQRALLADGVVATQEFEEANRKTLIQDLANLENKTDINTLELNIETLKRQQLEIEQTFMNSQLNFKNAIKEALQLLKNGLIDWELKYLLKANIAGRCVYKAYFNDYRFVQKEEKIFSLIPTKITPYFALLQLPIQGAGKVKEKQAVYVKLNNYPFMEFGVLKGRVSTISAIPFDDHYNVQVSFPATLVSTYGDTLVAQPLMHGIGEVIVERKSLYNRISEQIKSARLNK